MSDVVKAPLQLPIGAVVAAYPAAQFQPGKSPTAAPPVAATESGITVASNGTATFLTLVAGTRYKIGYDSGGGVWRYVDFWAGSSQGHIEDPDAAAAITAEAASRTAGDLAGLSESEFAARMASGTLAARPAAATYGVGFYYATDDNGGTLYRSDGSAWTKVAAGVLETGGTQLGYGERASNFPSTTTYANVLDGTGDVPGLTATVTGGRPIRIIVDVPSGITNSLATTSTLISILEDGVEIKFWRIDIGVASERNPVHFSKSFTPTAGSHTYKAVLTTLAAATTTIVAGAKTEASLEVLAA